MAGRNNLRRAEPDDAEAIAALTRAAYEMDPVIGRAPKPMTADYDEAVRAHLIDLLLEDRPLVALIECIREPDHLLIENLAVAPEAQGNGHGKLLMAHVEDPRAQPRLHADPPLHQQTLRREHRILQGARLPHRPS